MPRSGARSKENRGKSHQAAALPAPTAPSPEANPFQELAPEDDEGPSQDQAESSAGADGPSESGAVAAGSSEAPSSEESGDPTIQASSLAEDLLDAPSALPAQDPVRVETAACLRRCILDGTTLPAWVLELVMPGSTRPLGGPSEGQISEVRGEPMLQQNLDVVFQGVQSAATQATPVQQSSTSGSSSASPPEPSLTAPLPSPLDAARTTTAITNTRPSSLDPARISSAEAAPHAVATSNPHTTCSHTDYGKFPIKTSDLPASLKLVGSPTEDVPEIMALFRSSIRLHAPDGTPDSAIDHYAVRHLALLVSGEAANTMNQLQCETLEWRIDKELAQLSATDGAIEMRAPRGWQEWGNALTNLFSPVNRIVLLACTISNLKQGTSESVDSYGLRVTQAYARLLADSKRTAPSNVSPYKHAWQTSLMATFESGLIPDIHLELIREYPSLSYQASRTRAKKHETNALGGPTPPPTTYASAVTGSSPGPDRQLITSMANIEKSIVSKLTAVRGRGKSVAFDTTTYDPSDKRGRSASNDNGRARKSKVASGNRAISLCAATTTLTRVLTVGLPRNSSRKVGESRGLTVEGARTGFLKPVRGVGKLGSLHLR